MMRRTYLLAAGLGVLAMLSAPAAASAQAFRPQFLSPAVYNSLRPFTPVNNTLVGGYIGNTLSARALYTNAYLNRAVGNAFAYNANLNGSLYQNAVLTNTLLGVPNSSAVNTLGTNWANSTVAAQGFYINSYLNRAVGNAFNYTANTNAGLYNSLSPNYNFTRAGYGYNPYTSTLTQVAATTNPYGTFYRVNSTPYNPLANYYNSFAYNPTPYYTTPYYNPVGYSNPYASYYNPYNYYNPYAYTNPYAGGNFYNPYMYYNPYASGGSYNNPAASTSNPYVSY